MNKRGQEFNMLSLFVVGVATLIIAVIIMFVMVQNVAEIETSDGIGNVGLTETYAPLTTATQTLSPVGEGITSETVQVYNNTWLEFDGVDDVINTTNPMNNLAQSSYTFTILLRTPLVSSNDASVSQYFFSSVNTGDYTIPYFALQLRKSGIQFRYRDSLEDNTINNISQLPDEWVYVTGIFDNENNLTKLYRNGFHTSSINYVGGFQNLTSNTLFIGGGDVAFFNGSLDNINIYNYSMNDTEVKKDYLIQHTQDGRNIPILYLHDINDSMTSSDSYAVNQSFFNETMYYLYTQGFETILFNDYYDYKFHNNFTLPQKPIIITFDDHYQNVFDYGIPIMEQYNFKGVMAIVTGKADGSIAGTFMNYSDLQIMQDTYGWEMASHSLTHPLLRDGGLTEQQIIDQLNLSKVYIDSNLSSNIRVFIYPNGNANDTTDEYCMQFYDFCISKGLDLPQIYLNSPFSTPLSGKINGLTRLGFRNTTSLNDLYGLSLIHSESYNYENPILTYKFNENSGTTAYDSSGNNNHGTISGATWNNDGILVTLTNGVDYTLNTATGLLTMSSEYVYDYVMTAWTYTGFASGSVNTMRSNFVAGVDNVSKQIPVIFTILAIIILVSIFVLIYAIYRKMVGTVGGI